MGNEMTEEMELDCNIEILELVKKGESLAASSKNYIDLKNTKKNYDARMNAQIKNVEEEIELLSECIEKKSEKRMVECKWQIDFDRGIKTLFRPDTYKKIPDTETKIVNCKYLECPVIERET